MTRITLLSDFGTTDGYVAAMKGVIAEIAPSVLVDDATHYIDPGDIAAAAHALRRYWKLYPSGTVHVVVVDPGVGSERRALAVRADGRILVGPDNGVFTYVLTDATDKAIVEITNPRFTRAQISNTFHGRDVFAPAAAHLANGAPFAAVGATVNDPILIAFPPPLVTEAAVRGEIVSIDRFGNLATNIPASMVRPDATAECGGREVRVVQTYAEAEEGEPVALVNSDGVLEIAMRDADAADALGAGRGDTVVLRLA